MTLTDYKTKECDVCWSRFTPTVWNQLRCTERCKLIGILRAKPWLRDRGGIWSDLATDPLAAPFMTQKIRHATCLICGAFFSGENWNIKYCSDECRAERLDLELLARRLSRRFNREVMGYLGAAIMDFQVQSLVHYGLVTLDYDENGVWKTMTLTNKGKKVLGRT